MKALDRKLAVREHGAPAPSDFILADAKDADMAFGVQAPGPRGSGYLTRPQYLEHMRAEVKAAAVDILLTSASNGEVLATEGLFVDSPVTLAIRANDTTDIWNPRGSRYASQLSRPFGTANLERVREFSDLVLYSVTFNGDIEADLRTLEAFAAFRDEASRVEIRYFLEVFNPNAPVELGLTDPAAIGAFVNDHIVRALAGVTAAQRPTFLKMAFNGAGPTQELAEHDPSLVIGVLGGSAGTNRDTFELLHQAQQAGAQVSLFGRKIQRCESQLDLLAGMRAVVNHEATPEQAVLTYHEALAKAGIAPARSLSEDQKITEPVLGG